MQVELSDKCFLCRRLEDEGLSHLAPASIALQAKSLGKVQHTRLFIHTVALFTLLPYTLLPSTLLLFTLLPSTLLSSTLSEI